MQERIVDLSVRLHSNGNTFSQLPHISFCQCNGCGLELNPEYKPSYTPPPVQLGVAELSSSLQLPSSDAISVTYQPGFTAEAQAAFQFAVNIWNSLLQTPVPVVINATFQPAASPFNLGSAGPNNVVKGFTGAPLSNTYYPIAVANQLAGSDLNGATAEISANFNSSRTDWYFGTDGNVPAGKVDFVSVVLHEIGHGLGFLDTFDRANNNLTGQSGNAFNPSYIYDTFVENGANQRLLSAFANPSTQLGDQLISNNLFLDSPLTTAANGGTAPKLYAPTTFAGGSSIGHLDEATFNNTANALMTPQLNYGEAVHNPGAIVLGMLRDMGWKLAGSSSGPANDNFASRLLLTSFTASTTGTNAGATGESGEPSHGAASATPLNSVWWDWTAPSSGNVTIATTGSNFDTTLGVYTGSSVAGLIAIASNDDFGGSNGTSSVTFATVGGTSYKIAVDGYGATTGNINLGIAFTPNTPSTFAIAATNAVQSEGNSGSKAYTFTVTRGGDTSIANNVNWAVTGSSANPANATDFGSSFPTGMLSFSAGETSKQVTVNVQGDTTIETDEEFTVTLSNPTAGASIITPSAIGTIKNDDLPATFAIAATNAIQTEGHSGSKAYTFTVTRSGSTGAVNNVNWAVAGSGVNSASASDFGSAFPTGTLSFSAGQTSKQITVNVRGDINSEANEDFTVTLSNPTAGASIITPTAIGTIQNDDAPPTLAIAATYANQTEGNYGNKGFTFTVTRTGDTTVTSTANWSVAGSGANPADVNDFSATSGTVSFSAGQTSKTVTVSVKGDAIAELDESFTVSLSGATGTTVIGTAAANGTIRNDDQIVGTAGNDTLTGLSGNDTISGLGGMDVLSGLLGNDSIDGGLDNDILTGGLGNDTLIGNSGNDTLIGADSITGGANEIDRITGSAGSDRFVLGDAIRTYYVGNGMADYVLISDFGTGDVLQKYGNDTLTIGGALPTGVTGRAIYFGTDLVAVVQGAVPTLASFVSAV